MIQLKKGVEKMKNKSNGGLIAIIIILVIALLGLSFYMAYDKGLIFNNEKETTEEENIDENKNDLDSNTYVEDTSNINISYYTDNSHYYLILYPEVVLSNVYNAARGEQDKMVNSFYLGVNGGTFYDVIYGQYEISDGKITLRFIGNGYTYNIINNSVNASVFNNINIQSISEHSHYITVDYSDEKIIFGNAELIKK